jgi:cation/acetate symporter
MSILDWTYIMVGVTFSLYLAIAWISRVQTTKGFYVAGGGVGPVANGMATAADWMSAASFISMAGLISFMGYTGSIYLLGWTGGYVLLALMLAPYLRKFGKFTVPDFIGDRYYSNKARLIALICAIFVSFTYVAGQMRGVGIVFSRFLEVDVNTGVLIGMALIFVYASLGGMKGITYTQVAQYSVLIVAYLVPAFAISMQITGTPIPQLGFGGTILDGPNSGQYLIETLNKLNTDLGFAEYTRPFAEGGKPMLDVFCITLALMVGTAGLPHVIVRFFTVPNVRAARLSAGFALLFIAVLYTTAPAIGAFARYNMLNSIKGATYSNGPSWLKNWEKTGLIAWVDKNHDGVIDYRPGEPFSGKPDFIGETGSYGQLIVGNVLSDSPNELYIDHDIMVLANPEIANLSNWVIALVAAGGLAAALSTASGLLLVISSSISHDLYYRLINKNASEKKQLLVGRIMIGVSVCIAGYFGIHPPGFVAQVVAFAFGLAASSFFPVLVLGIFSKRTTKEGAIAGMIVGISFTMIYIININFLNGSPWFFGISAEGIGAVGMVINFITTLVITRFTPPPPLEVQEMVDEIRVPMPMI